MALAESAACVPLGAEETHEQVRSWTTTRDTVRTVVRVGLGAAVVGAGFYAWSTNYSIPSMAMVAVLAALLLGAIAEWCLTNVFNTSLAEAAMMPGLLLIDAIDGAVSSSSNDASARLRVETVEDDPPMPPGVIPYPVIRGMEMDEDAREAYTDAFYHYVDSMQRLDPTFVPRRSTAMHVLRTVRCQVVPEPDHEPTADVVDVAGVADTETVTEVVEE